MSPRRTGAIPEPERTQLLAAARSLDKAEADLRDAVRAARSADGSVREIARVIGKSPTTIQAWTQDRRNRLAPGDRKS